METTMPEDDALHAGRRAVTEATNDAPKLGGRAVVLGASLAGLLAARVLSERFDDVLLLERDLLPEQPEARKGTPHAVHPHGLLARGREVMEQLFPGFTAALLAQGAVSGDLQRDMAFDAGRRRFASGVAGRTGLGASRLAIEAELRRRVRALPGVRVLCGVDALPPLLRDGRVVAARWRPHYPSHYPGAAEATLPADLVVDCSGRGSRVPQWLREWGYDAPAEERVDIGICYTSAYFRRTGGCAIGPGLDKVAAFGAVTNEQPRPGVVIAQEPAADGVPRWVVAVGGFAGDHADATLPALRQRALDIGAPELVKLTHEAELIGGVMRYRMPHSQRRRYERLQRFPAGLLALGDAITSFNPIYGQGMTVAACEALALREQLAQGLADGRVIDTPWQLAVGGDLSIDRVPGHRPAPVKLVNAYVARVYRAAPRDPVVSLAFQQVVHMLAPPASLFAPRILWRVLRRGGRATAVAKPGTAEAAVRLAA
jgi:2-polyprenyl-6-methoxyphenol hydroxylase-like FAD-dependent oxidoreductase